MTPIPSMIDLKTLAYISFEEKSKIRVLRSKDDFSWKPVLEVRVIPSIYQDKENVGISWSILSRTSQNIKIKVVFEKALYISYEMPDMIVFTFADQRLFISDQGIMI